MNIGHALSNSNFGSKKYWSLINKALNKPKLLLIPPLLENGFFILDFEKKAQIFNDYLILQCRTLETGDHIHEVMPGVPLLSNITIS